MTIEYIEEAQAKREIMKEGNPTLMLEREIHSQVARINNAVFNRKHHPTYGYTKTRMYAQIHQLEGLLYAWYAVTNFVRRADFEQVAAEAAAYLDVDLTQIRILVKNA